jgi:heme A synthase
MLGGMTTTPPTARADRTTRAKGPWFAALTGLTSAMILVQAITAGQFVSQAHRHGWISVHEVTANVTQLAALASAVYAIIALRKTQPGLTWGSVVLFVLLVVQAGLGYAITDGHQDGLIGVHVPLAMIVFGLTVWLSLRAALARRATP